MTYSDYTETDSAATLATNDHLYNDDTGITVQITQTKQKGDNRQSGDNARARRAKNERRKYENGETDNSSVR